MPTGTIDNPTLAKDLLDVLDKLSGGIQAGFRPAHAKGLMCEGTFTPSPRANELTRAKLATAPSTPVTVRFSNATGLPTIADNDGANAGPRGLAIRFHVGAHEHTDIVAQSLDGFPVRTGEEFLTFLRAVVEAVVGGKPQDLGAFLASHPNAKRVVETPKPITTSFAREAYFAVTAFKFTNAAGQSRFGRYRFRPEAGTEYLTEADAKTKSPNFLFDEIAPRLAKGPVRFNLFVQLAEPGDDPTDASTPWPADREEFLLGTITLTSRVDHDTPDRRKIIFDPHPRTDGIDPSGDPLTSIRADIYLMSGRRRRAASGDAGH